LAAAVHGGGTGGVGGGGGGSAAAAAAAERGAPPFFVSTAWRRACALRQWAKSVRDKGAGVGGDVAAMAAAGAGSNGALPASSAASAFSYEATASQLLERVDFLLSLAPCCPDQPVQFMLHDFCQLSEREARAQPLHGGRGAAAQQNGSGGPSATAPPPPLLRRRSSQGSGSSGGLDTGGAALHRQGLIRHLEERQAETLALVTAFLKSPLDLPSLRAAQEAATQRAYLRETGLRALRGLLETSGGIGGGYGGSSFAGIGGGFGGGGGRGLPGARAALLLQLPAALRGVLHFRASLGPDVVSLRRYALAEAAAVATAGTAAAAAIVGQPLRDEAAAMLQGGHYLTGLDGCERPAALAVRGAFESLYGFLAEELSAETEAAAVASAAAAAAATAGGQRVSRQRMQKAIAGSSGSAGSSCCGGAVVVAGAGVSAAAGADAADRDGAAAAVAAAEEEDRAAAEAEAAAGARDDVSLRLVLVDVWGIVVREADHCMLARVRIFNILQSLLDSSVRRRSSRGGGGGGGSGCGFGGGDAGGSSGSLAPRLGGVWRRTSDFGDLVSPREEPDDEDDDDGDGGGGVGSDERGEETDDDAAATAIACFDGGVGGSKHLLTQAAMKLVYLLAMQVATSGSGSGGSGGAVGAGGGGSGGGLLTADGSRIGSGGSDGSSGGGLHGTPALAPALTRAQSGPATLSASVFDMLYVELRGVLEDIQRRRRRAAACAALAGAVAGDGANGAGAEKVGDGGKSTVAAAASEAGVAARTMEATAAMAATLTPTTAKAASEGKEGAADAEVATLRRLAGLADDVQCRELSVEAQVLVSEVTMLLLCVSGAESCRLYLSRPRWLAVLLWLLRQGPPYAQRRALRLLRRLLPLCCPVDLGEAVTDPSWSILGIVKEPTAAT
ncbi:unnamed protein product, partial [Phaeothamnion confervicola]